MKQRVFSGIQPTGRIHIGNYLGAIRNWVTSQNAFENFFCIADLHAITVPQGPQSLKAKIREMVCLLLASGITLEKSVIFIQSEISAHAELAWILNCFIPMGWLKRMTQYKEKTDNLGGSVNVGLFDYPVLMASDILLYKIDFVPVGEDQKQHLELTRDIAKRFNAIYGDTFRLPEPLISGVGGRIMGLDEPRKKMSKSDTKKAHAIYLLDSADDIRLKISSAVTDSHREICFDMNRFGIYNLLLIYELFTGLNRSIIEEQYKGKDYVEFKRDLSEVIIENLRPIQRRYTEFSADSSYIETLLAESASKIRPIANETLIDVKNRIGLG